MRIELPDEIVTAIERINSRSWTGTFVIHFKEGGAIAFDLTEKHRIGRPMSAPSEKGRAS